MNKSIEFLLNGKATEATCRPDMTVLEWLRGDSGLRGSKEGCAEGDCGACSVLFQTGDDVTYSPANSCILLMGQLEGGNLITVEGLASSEDEGHPVQQLMAENGSSQCGFCTPGIVCALAGLGERILDPTESDIHDALAGNLCRCTGYRPIVEAAKEAVNRKKPKLPLDSKQQPSAKVGTEECAYFIPNGLNELLDLRAKHPEAILLAGGTDLSLDVAHARARWHKILSTRFVSELREIDTNGEQVTFGGAVTWGKALPVISEYWPSFSTLIRRFGSVQIRTMGTIAGNIANASPIGDGAPALIALGASVLVKNLTGERIIPLDEFFQDYRKPDLKPDEIIVSVTVPKLAEHDNFRVYKISKRYDQDISTVCAAFNLTVENNIVTQASMAFGGMAATPIRCGSAEEFIVGKSLSNRATVSEGVDLIRSAFSPMSDMRGSKEYRAIVAANLFERFVLDITNARVEVMAV